MHARQPSGYGHRTHRQESGARRGRVIRGRLAATARVDAGRGSHRARRRGLTRAAAWSLLALAATLAVPAYAQTEYWSAQLTVEQDSGFPSHIGYSSSNNHGSITDRTFDLGSNSYTILYFVTNTTNNQVKFALTSFPTHSDFAGKILRIGSRSLSFDSSGTYGQEYRWTSSSASGEFVEGQTLSVRITGTPPTPGKVTGVTVTPGVGGLAVSWTAVSGADGYKVQWKSGSEEYGSSRQQVISGGSMTSSTIPDLDGGTAYSVQVIATATGADDGGPSDTKTGTPTLPTISIDDGSGGEASGAVAFKVSLNDSYHQPVSATWSTGSGGTATAGTDYTSVSSARVTIPAGSTSTNISVTVLSDSEDELAETFMVRLSSPANATLTDATATGTIMDDDLPTVSISAGASPVTEGTAATFTVQRGIADPAALVVRLESSQTGEFISATLPSSVTIAGGSTSATVSVATVNDSMGEADGSVTVAIAANAASYQVGSSSRATVDIEDDDASFTLDIAGGGNVDEDVGNATFTVTLTSDDPVSEPISVQWRTVNGTAMAGSDYMGGDGGDRHAHVCDMRDRGDRQRSARTTRITVDITDDMRDENDETFTVMLSNASGAGAGIGPRARPRRRSPTTTCRR